MAEKRAKEIRVVYIIIFFVICIGLSFLIGRKSTPVTTPYKHKYDSLSREYHNINKEIDNLQNILRDSITTFQDSINKIDSIYEKQAKKDHANIQFFRDSDADSSAKFWSRRIRQNTPER